MGYDADRKNVAEEILKEVRRQAESWHNKLLLGDWIACKISVERIMKSDRLYRRETGVRYYTLRSGRRSHDVQLTRVKLFADITNEHDVALDFGCGTGFVLAALPARRRIGVEINDLAAQEARTKLGLRLIKSTRQ